MARKIADSMDTDHVATVAFAHWPDASSPWHQVLRRVARLSPVLGKFMLLDDYFSHTDMPGRISKFGPDEYRTPYLTQAVAHSQSDPISGFVAAHRTAAERSAAEAVATMHDLITGKVRPNACAAGAAEAAPPVGTALPPKVEPRAGYVVANALSFGRRIGLETTQLQHVPAAEPPVVAAGQARDRKFAVLEVPFLGFAWVGEGLAAVAPSRGKPLAKENVLATSTSRPR